MREDVELVLLFGSLHLIALAFGLLLFWQFLHSETMPEWRPDDDSSDGGDGGSKVPRRTPDPPKGPGLPLPNAAQAALRLRGPGRLADAYPRRQRRPAREPVRTPERALLP